MKNTLNNLSPLNSRPSARVRSWSLALLGSLALSAGFSAPAAAQLRGSAEPTVDAAVESIITDFMAEKAIPGMTVAASVDGRMVMNKSYGLRDKENGHPMYYYHRTRMASLSKVLNALTLVKYSEDADPGLLDRSVYGSNSVFSAFDYSGFYSAMSEGWLRQTPVVATMISKENDRVFTYYDSGEFSVGTTSDLDAHSAPQTYILPAGKEPQDIAGIASMPGDYVFAWYKDETVSYGTHDNLGAGFVTDFTLPEGQQIDYLVGIGLSNPAGKVYAWWEDGTRTVGTYLNLGAYNDVKDYFMPVGQSPYTIRSIAISKNDKVYTFYSNETVSKGTSRYLDHHLAPYSTALPPQINVEPWLYWSGLITPRHLLNHSAGFESAFWLAGATVRATGSLATDPLDSNLGMELLHEYALSSGRKLFAPGTDNNYSNHGAALAGLVLEEESGIPFMTMLRTTVLYPLGLDMGRVWEHHYSDSEPHWDNNKYNNDPPDVVNCDCPVPFNFREASGYLTSSAGDYLRVMMSMDLASDPGRRILSDAGIALMETPGPGPGYGLGWRIRDAAGWLDHGGALRGGASAVSRFKAGYVKDGVVMDDVTVVVMGNLNTPMRALSEELAKTLSQLNIDPTYDLF
ncbi:MAG: serine hydrolase domain-containing protein [Acidobacteriota bacterium]